MAFETPSECADVIACLQRRRNDLLALLQGHREDGKPVELDQTRVGRLSRMDALQGQAMAQETERRRQEELARIDAAMKRVEDGTYGDCVGCGEPIAKKRLALDPSAALCIECAEQARR